MKGAEEYFVSPQAYLSRAREQLLIGSAQCLFYAAFELRCFVESRQDEYLEAQREYASSVPKSWKIGAQGKALEAIFENANIQQITWVVGDETVYEAHYVPVSAHLRNAVQRFGELLHAATNPLASDNSWWEKTAVDVHNAYELAWQCNRGRLLSPMCMVDGHAVGKMMVDPINEEAYEKLVANMKAGTRGLLKVDYLDVVPDDWRSDLAV